MNLKTLALAGSLAVSATFANAATEIFDGGSTSILDFGVTNEYVALVNTDGGAGDFDHTFTVVGAGTGHMSLTIGNITAADFTNLRLSWLDSSDAVLATTLFAPTETTLSTIFVDPATLTQKMVLSWDTSATSGFDAEVSITVSPIPLPAGVLLLGTALGGLGLARRRKKAA